MQFAHSREDRNRETWQELQTHLENVSDLASSFAPESLKPLARIAGLWHDIGKYQAAFQRYIGADPEGSNKELGVPHAGAGAALAMERFGMTHVGFMVSCAIEAHHGELKSPDALLSAMETRGKRLLKDARAGGLPAVIDAETAASPGTPSALATRMLFSAVVDADLLDTEAWDRGVARQTSTVTMEELRDTLDAACSALMQRAEAQATSETERALLTMRRQVYRACVERAQCPAGQFTLTVPTGGGKTLSGLAFALHHAAKHGKQRVLVVAPYTSILEQTADVYRNIFGADVVIEHHSTIDPAVDTDRNRQACENWDAPIIVTTSVQLLESLHAAHKRPCRKLHRIANSVILLDEVQTFPVGLLQPIHAVLQRLVEQFGVTVVHGTATQPLLSGGAPPSRRSSTPAVFRIEKTEIMDDPAALFRVVKDRFRMEALGDLKEPLDPALLVQDVQRQHSALVITHRRDDARRLAEMLGDGCLHLSAAMCAAHRSEVLRMARQRLAAGEPCIVVATQLVEAGVDVDFPVVYRALAGLETLAQAAGRCNRSMKLPQPGRFVVYRAGIPGLDEDDPPKESTPPVGTPKLGMGIAWNEYFRHGMPDLSDPAIFPAYTAKVLALSATDDKALLEAEEHWNFPRVAADFRMVDQPKISVVAPYGDGPLHVSHLRGRQNPSRADYRALQRYTVGVSAAMHQAMYRAGWLEPLREAADSPMDTVWCVRAGDGAPYHERFGFAGKEQDVRLRSLQV